MALAGENILLTSKQTQDNTENSQVSDAILDKKTGKRPNGEQKFLRYKELLDKPH